MPLCSLRHRWLTSCRVGLSWCGAQLGTISVGPGSQSPCTKVCRIGRGAQLGAIGPIGLRPALPNWPGILECCYFIIKLKFATENAGS